ncbi:MAG: hypothetical protein ACRCTR_06790 [Actinomycetota bacterium]
MPRSFTFVSGLVISTAAFALAGCSGDESAPASSNAAPLTSASASPSTGSSPTNTAPASTGTKKSYSQKIEDDVLGHRIAFTSVVRGFSSKEYAWVTEEGGEFVLIQVDAVAGEKYGGGVYGGWKLQSPDGETHIASTLAKPDMKAAGYEPLEGVISRGESGKGWVAFQVDKISPTYTLVYTRPAANVIGSDEVIPKKVWEFPLS